MAGYVEKTLAPDERIVHRVHFNWTFSFFPVLWFAFGSAPIVMYATLQYSSGIPYEDLRVGWWFVLAAFLTGAIILINHLIILWTTEIAVTTYRFVFKEGLISRKTQEVSLNKIEEILLQQTVWGRVFGYGKLILRGTGVGKIELPNIDNPIEIRKIIEKSKADLRKETNEDNRGDDD